MDIRHLREFLVFSEHLNFSAASRDLFIAQPTLSQHIASMEEELGFLLVDRSKPDLRLTSAGEQFLDATQDILNRYDKTVKDCRSYSPVSLRVHDFRQSVRIAPYLEGALAEFRKRHPTIPSNIKYVPFERHSVEETLRRDECDISFVFAAHESTREIGLLRSEGFEVFLLRTEPCHIYTTPDSALAQSTVTLSDIRGRRFTAYNHPALASFRSAIKETFGRLGVDLDCKLFPYDSGNDMGILEDERYLVIDCREHYLQSIGLYHNSDRIVEKSIDGLDLVLDVYAVYRPPVTSPSVEELLSILESAHSREPTDVSGDLPLPQ